MKNIPGADRKKTQLLYLLLEYIKTKETKLLEFSRNMNGEALKIKQLDFTVSRRYFTVGM